MFDVSGAGDTVIGVMAAAVGAGASLVDAAMLANVGAGIVVGKLGTAVAHKSDIIQALHRQDLSSAEAKIMSLERAVDMVTLWRDQGLKIGFTNGIFDVLQPRHINLLTKAAKVCDRLIVGLNSDASANKLRKKKLLQHESARSSVVAFLDCVNIVVIFQEETPAELLKALRPDVLIKGANYSRDKIVGAEIVENYGGEIIVAEIDQKNT